MFTRIEQPKISQEVFRQIKQQIAAGYLCKGDKLPSERQLAESFGVSRTTIRETVKTLEMMGLIECLQGNGNYIASNLSNSLIEPLSIMFMLEEGSILHIQQLRRAVEIAAAELAARGVPEKKMAELEDDCMRMESDISEEDRAQVDLQFHLKIAALSKNPLIVTVLKASSLLIGQQLKDVRERLWAEEVHKDKLNRQHREIVRALAEGNGNLAARRMEEHMDLIERFLMTLGDTK